MEIAWSERRPPSRKLLAIAAGFAALTALGIAWLDVPIAEAIAVYEPSEIWRTIIHGLEWIVLLPVHSLLLPVVLVVAMVVAIAVRPWRGAAPAWMTIAGVELISRLTTNWIKDATGRLRPTQWLGHDVGAMFGHAKGVAFPSGHVALFAGLAIPIAVVAMSRSWRWRRPIAIAAIAVVAFVCAARMAVGAHWLSDTTGAVTLVVLWTYLQALVARP